MPVSLAFKIQQFKFLPTTIFNIDKRIVQNFQLIFEKRQWAMGRSSEYLLQLSQSCYFFGVNFLRNILQQLNFFLVLVDFITYISDF